MNKTALLTREVLNKRHRLSHEQIDALLNENLSKENKQEKFQLVFQIGEFLRLTDVFQKHCIPFTPLKGPILSYRLHKDASFRYSNDLDFLFSIETVEKVIKILEDQGYKPHLFPWPKHSVKRQRLVRSSNQILFVNPANQIHIEIHWKLFKSRITDNEILTNVIESNKENLVFQNRKFHIFNNELELVYLIIHGGKHAWFRLKWLLDVKDFIENIPVDRQKFNDLVTQLNAGRMVALCNATLAEYFPACPLLPCSPELSTNERLDFTIKQIEYKDYYDKSLLERIRTYLFEINCFPGMRFKLSVLRVIFYGKYSRIFEFKQNSLE